MTLLGRDVVVVVVAFAFAFAFAFFFFTSSSYSHRHRHRRCIILIFIADVVVVVVVVIGAASPSAHDFSAKPLPAILRTAIQGTHFFPPFFFRFSSNFFPPSRTTLNPTREAAFGNWFVPIATATERET